MGGTEKCYQMQAPPEDLKNKRLPFLSKNSLKKSYENINRKDLRLVQVFPSPKYPVLHVHLNDPLVLVHTALALHVCVPLAHSSMSEKKIIYIYIYIYAS